MYTRRKDPESAPLVYTHLRRIIYCSRRPTKRSPNKHHGRHPIHPIGTNHICNNPQHLSSFSNLSVLLRLHKVSSIPNVHPQHKLPDRSLLLQVAPSLLGQIPLPSPASHPYPRSPTPYPPPAPHLSLCACPRVLVQGLNASTRHFGPI